MIISVNWLKKFTDIDVSIDELATLIGSRLVEIEEVINLGAKYDGVVIARVAECGKLEGSDHLNVAKLDDGGVTKVVERDENGFVQVVCGAPNVRAGILVAWLPPGSTVPETHHHDEPFVLGARKLRGAMSNGMIASAKELDLFDDHTGILEIDRDCAPGTSFAEVYELDDYLLDIENKSLTHRPDAFGIIGFAREVAAIQGKAFKTPEWMNLTEADFAITSHDVIVPTAAVDDESLSDRYQAVILSGANGDAQSPLFIQTYLSRVGVRPINAIVDVTNYLMMLTGQPLHAFDYDKVLAVSGGRNDIHVRTGRNGELLALLDGRTIELSQEDIVIAAGDTAIALAGAMGGADTEIDATTRVVILESATFNLYRLRSTQMRHGIFSEAITRFTKGQPASLTAPVLIEAVHMLSSHTGAYAISPVVEAYPGARTTKPILLTIEQVNETLGTKFSTADAIEILQNVEFTAAIQTDERQLAFAPPFWRSDIHIPEDLIEEIGRLNGFDSIEPTVPRRDFTAIRPSEFDQLRTMIRKTLVRAGANEVLTYSFVHGDMITKAGQNTGDSYRITNSISPQLQYYRQSLTPSLLNLVHSNIKAGYDQFALFEINKVHSKAAPLTIENVPTEMNTVALTVTNKKNQAGAPFYQAKRLLEYVGSTFGLDLAVQPYAEVPQGALTAPFEPRRSGHIVEVASGVTIGIIGEYRRSVASKFKLPSQTAGFEISPEQLLAAMEHRGASYVPLSRYPSAERDICFQVPSEVLYSQIVDAVAVVLSSTELETSVAPIDLYRAEAAKTKNITIRIKLTSHERTLNGEEVQLIVGDVICAVTNKTNGVVI